MINIFESQYILYKQYYLIVQPVHLSSSPSPVILISPELCQFPCSWLLLAQTEATASSSLVMVPADQRLTVLSVLSDSLLKLISFWWEDLVEVEVVEEWSRWLQIILIGNSRVVSVVLMIKYIETTWTLRPTWWAELWWSIQRWQGLHRTRSELQLKYQD